MKNRLAIILFVAAMVFPLSSCLKETQPTGTITKERLDEVIEQDPDKYAAQVQAIYNDIQDWEGVGQSHNYFGQMGFNYLTSLMGNDMVMTGRYGMSIYHYLLDYWQHNYAPAEIRWQEYYKHIADANVILRDIPADTEDPTLLQYRAVALGIRGYSYLQLSYLFQHSYYVGADDTKWGKGDHYDFSNDPLCPLITEKTGEEDQPRATVDAIFTQLIGDLEASFALFEDLGAVHTPFATDFDGCVVANYLARAYMIKHDWKNAKKYASVIMDEYGVLSGDQLLQGFNSISLPDVVFGCDITADNTGIYRSWFSMMDYFGDGYAGIGVWRAGFGPFVDAIADNDIRREWFLDLRNEYLGLASVLYQSIKFIGAGRSKVFATIKVDEEGYPSWDGSGWELGDYIYLRSEEAYFMYIECLAHEGNLDDSAELLTAFMQTRQPGYECPATDKASLIEEIIFQKRVEFWGEGMEFLDNRRLNIPVDRSAETWGAPSQKDEERLFTPGVNNHYPGADGYWDQEDENFLYQLPDSEMETNPKITEEDQN